MFEFDFDTATAYEAGAAFTVQLPSTVELVRDEDEDEEDFDPEDYEFEECNVIYNSDAKTFSCSIVVTEGDDDEEIRTVRMVQSSATESLPAVEQGEPVTL